jgi:hypothetical protein
MSSPIRSRWRVGNAALVLFLAILFYAFFQGSKQFTPLAQVNPFSVDPYDAIGSFGFQAALLLAGLSFLRSLRITSETTSEAKLFLARSQVSSVLAVAVTLVADVVALMRHPDAWSGTTPGRILTLMVLGLIVVTTTIGVRVYGSSRGLGVPFVVGAWRSAVLVCLATLIVLAIYPETSTSGRLGALFAIAAGIVLLFLPIRMLVVAILPDSRTQGGESNARLTSRWRLAVIGFALLAGIFAALGESTEGGGGPRLLTSGRLPPVVLVFIAFEAVAILTAYALLAKPLGLRPALIRDS